MRSARTDGIGQWLASGMAAAAFALLAAVPVGAQGPAFDCRKASGEVETLICQDAGLATLDRTLDSVYKAAMAKARDAMPATLRTEQRGWVSGRNECWKAKGSPTFLTESWQVSTVRDCVAANYRLRISELQLVWQLVDLKPPVTYACQGNRANAIVAVFAATDPATVRLERGDRVATAWSVPAASGTKYEGQNVSFWSKGPDASVTWLDETLQCKVQ
jgi:uncharacterized protein